MSKLPPDENPLRPSEKSKDENYRRFPTKRIFEMKRGKTSDQLIQQQDKESEERRDQIYQAIEAWVKEEREKSPNFYLTQGNLEKWLKNNSHLIFGITSVSGVLRYWHHDIDGLRQRLGMPIKSERDY